MPAIKDSTSIARKWATVTPSRSGDYEEGVKNPKRSWANATKKAEDRYKEGVKKAADEGRFGKGVENAGDDKWQRGATEKGVARWGQGVTIAEGEYEKGFAPYAEVIRGTKLPPRYPKGDPRNIQRVTKMAAALHKAKIS